MPAVETINQIITTKLPNSNLKYCLVDSTKKPYKIDGTLARPNIKENFVDLFELANSDKLFDFVGVGISIQASEICAIDVDKCFSIPFDITSGDDRAKDIIERFKEIAYIEFSFSGTGLRVLFKEDVVEEYSSNYYIKNESNKVEYYQPNNSFRYVTVTGRYIVNNEIALVDGSKNVLNKFLNDYMQKPKKQDSVIKTTKEETRTFEQLSKLVKLHYFKNKPFQDLWFDKAPGSGSNESERDFYLVAYLYENITQDKELIKQLFESSPFFKSKDWKHINKWNYNNYRYFEYLYKNICI